MEYFAKSIGNGIGNYAVDNNRVSNYSERLDYFQGQKAFACEGYDC